MAFSNRTPFKHTSLIDILTTPLPPVNWLIEPLIPVGDRVLVYGEFAALKSWLLLHLGLHVAAGRDWLGRFKVKQGNVVYIDEEMHPRTLARRVKRLCEGMGWGGQGGTFNVISHEGVKFGSTAGTVLLDKLDLTGLAPDLIIVEALRRVLAGSENKAEDVADFWRSIAPIMMSGKTFIVSHHMRKPKSEGEDSVRWRASGTTDLQGGCDTVFAVSRQAKTVALLECVKIREAEESPTIPVTFTFAPLDGPVSAVAGEVMVHSPGTVGILAAMDMLQSFIGASGEATRSDILKYAESIGISRGTLDRVLTLLETQHRIVRTGHGIYRIPDTVVCS